MSFDERSPTFLPPRREIFGWPVYEIPVEYRPKIQLSEDCPVSPEFRREFNQWLLEMFGAKDVSLIRKNQILISKAWGISMLRSDQMAFLRNLSV
jgi:hypothetical protein